MAQIGLRHFKYSPIGANGKYTGVNEMVGAIKATPSLNVAEADLYADDTVVESASEVTKGTLSLTVADDDDTIFAPLLGHTTTENGEVLKSSDDVAPYVVKLKARVLLFKHQQLRETFMLLIQQLMVQQNHYMKDTKHLILMQKHKPI